MFFTGGVAASEVASRGTYKRSRDVRFENPHNTWNVRGRAASDDFGAHVDLLLCPQAGRAEVGVLTHPQSLFPRAAAGLLSPWPLCITSGEDLFIV